MRDQSGFGGSPVSIYIRDNIRSCVVCSRKLNSRNKIRITLEPVKVTSYDPSGIEEVKVKNRFLYPNICLVCVESKNPSALRILATMTGLRYNPQRHTPYGEVFHSTSPIVGGNLFPLSVKDRQKTAYIQDAQRKRSTVYLNYGTHFVDIDWHGCVPCLRYFFHTFNKQLSPLKMYSSIMQSKHDSKELLSDKVE